MIIRSIAAAAIAVSFLAPVANATATIPNHPVDRGIISVQMVKHAAMKVGKTLCKKGAMLKGGKCVTAKMKK